MLPMQTPPHSIEAEQALLGAILVNNRALEMAAGILTPAMFFEPVHRRIFEAMLAMQARGQLIDGVTLAAAFRDDEALADVPGGGSRYLAGLAQAAAPLSSAEHYGDVIRDLGLKRGLMKAAADVHAAAADPAAADFTSLAGDLAGRINALSQIGEDRRIQTLADVLDSLQDKITMAEPPISTGLPKLDAAMGGGLRRGRVYAIEAPSKSFKTGTLASLSYAFMRASRRFLFATYEMSAADILQRAVAAHTRVNSLALEIPERRDDALGRVGRFRNELAGRPAFFADLAGATATSLMALMGKAIDRQGVELIIVDYFQRITGREHGQNMSEFLEQTAYQLADFAKRNNVALVIASQLNRQGESLGSDGLKRACDWMARQHKVEIQGDDRQGVWMDVAITRFCRGGDLGSAECPAFLIEQVGPILAEPTVAFYPKAVA